MANTSVMPLARYMPGITPAGDSDLFIDGAAETLTDGLRRVFARPQSSGNVVITFADAARNSGVILTLHALPHETGLTWSASAKLQAIVNGKTAIDLVSAAAATGEGFAYYSDGYQWVRMA